MNILKLKNIKNKKLYLLMALAAGIAVVMLSGLLPSEKESLPKEVQIVNMPDSDATEKRLKDIIETIGGVSDVSVFVTYENIGERKIATTSEETTTQDGTKRNSSIKSQIVTAKTNSGEEPFVSEEKLPEIRGVIICAKGVGSEEMRLLISDAVSGAMNVPIHRVKVLSKD